MTYINKDLSVKRSYTSTTIKSQGRTLQMIYIRLVDNVPNISLTRSAETDRIAINMANEDYFALLVSQKKKKK